MKINVFAVIVLSFAFAYGQDTSSFVVENDIDTNKAVTSSSNIGTNGYNFSLLNAGVNSKYSEFGSGFFLNKLIMVSSKKIGALAKIDPNTNEAYKDLFCLDIKEDGDLSTPLLFSRILNTNNSEDQLTFTPDEKTVYYTRSSKENSLQYKLYRADLEEDSHGNWINQELLSINQANISIENPFVSPKGDKLYFSSNMNDSYGGYDLYVADINPDGSLGTPENLGPNVNTPLDEKYPSLSLDGVYLYFSSKGHKNLGGYDVFVSRILEKGVKAPRNMGNTLNSSYDEVAYFLAERNKGYLSSNRPNGKGSYDMYVATNEEVKQNLEGFVVHSESKIHLPNTVVVLKDEDGNEVAKQLTDNNGAYNFGVLPFEVYTISTEKDGYINKTFDFTASEGTPTSYNKTLELDTTPPVIEKVDDKLSIVIENIYFDSAKWSLKEESHVSLNKIVKVLREHPEMRLSINAHTDNKGREAYNMNLSNKRAASAVAFLIKNGIAKSRLEFKGFGETQPKIDCKSKCTADELQQNRRVEFIILD
ncbi:OmpA family protein [Hyunsoonleella ulvae]|uniref:OmpA family protein n=1 Tax=Hyunsoonleella ulvae TaxID=2799948 RepID=UPI001939A6E0|nr:OmpA family protein [Hyunsoonleella ulvae]